MSPEAQRIAIAEASQGRIEFFEGVWYYWSGTTRFQCQDNDPLNDLNAMHEAVMRLPDKQRVEFRKQLQYIVSPRTKPARAGSLVLMGDKEYDAWFNATASQRAEAFLRTLDLWRD